MRDRKRAVKMAEMRRAAELGLGDDCSPRLLKVYREMNTTPDILDGLEKELKWCQTQCKRAAHKFLRDGDCSTKIANIKGKLEEVKQSAEKVMETIKQAEAANSDADEEGKCRIFKNPLIRKEFGGRMQDLEVDDNMEVQ